MRQSSRDIKINKIKRALDIYYDAGKYFKVFLCSVLINIHCNDYI